MSDDWIHNAIVKYEEGDLVAVPVEPGKYGVALVARWSKASRRDHKTVICYGFNRLFNHIPLYDEVKSLTPFDAVIIGIGGDRAIAHGYWKRIGPSPGFTYKQWPVPPFRGAFSGRPLWYVGDRLDIVDVRETVVPDEEMAVLPPDRGVGTSRFMEWCLDVAVRRATPEFVLTINEDVLEKWRRAEARGHVFRVDAKGKVHRTKPQHNTEEDRPADAAGEIAAEEHALLLHIPLAGKWPNEAERNRYHALQDELGTAIERAGVGEFDGDEWGEGLCTLYIYGPDTERLWKAVAPVLTKHALPRGSSAVKRYGGPGTRETRVSIGHLGSQARE